MSKEIQGCLFNIQRFSLHDGPGVRTTVFFKGCNARCAWCHNPESFTTRPQLSVVIEKCVSCGRCGQACPHGVHSFSEEAGHMIAWDRCTRCGECLLACPLSLLSIVGRAYTVDEVMEPLLRDRPYYEGTGGGVTFSGGEATVQHAFLLALMERCGQEGLHTCLETNGLIDPARLEALARHTDLFLFDFKLSDDALHRQYVGTPNGQVYASLDLLDRLGKAVVLRCPIIPGINDTQAHFAQIHTLMERLSCVEAVEIMPYHTTGASKWANIGLTYTLPDVQTPDKETERRWREIVSGDA